MTRYPERDTLVAAAIHHLEQVKIALAELDGPTYRYQRSTHTLWVDPRADVVSTIRDALVALAPAERELVAIPGGRPSTPVETIPQQQGSGEGERRWTGGPRVVSRRRVAALEH